MTIGAGAFRNAVSNKGALMCGLREAELPPLLMVLGNLSEDDPLLAEFVLYPLDAPRDIPTSLIRRPHECSTLTREFGPSDYDFAKPAAT